MIEWLVAYVESLGYIGIVGKGYFIVRKQDGNNYFDVDFRVVNPSVKLDEMTKIEAMGYADRAINAIVQMMSMAHRQQQGAQQ